MKKFKLWKEKVNYFLVLLMIVITIEIFLIPFPIHFMIRIYIFLAPLLGLVVNILWNVSKKRNIMKQYWKP